MTREEKLKKLAALEEKKRRLAAARTSYVPNAGQLPVHQSKKKRRFVFSGNGAGKTCMLVHEALWAVEGYNPITKEFTPVPCSVVVVLDKPEKSDTVFIPELKKWADVSAWAFKKGGRHNVTVIQHPNGSTVRFLTHDQDPLTFESIELDFALFDEPPPRPIYIALFRGGRKKGRQARYLMVGTPLAAPWLRVEVYEPYSRGELDDTECFRFGTKVNEVNLSEGYIESFKKILSEKEQGIRLEGNFFDLDDLALAHLLDRTKHIIPVSACPITSEHPCVVAIDPHPQKDHVAIILGADEHGYFYYLKELKSKLVPREFARHLKEWMKGFRVIDIVVDDYGSGEMTGGEGYKSFIQVLREEGVMCRPTTWKDKHDDDWIMRLQETLAVPAVANNFGQHVPKLRFLQGQCAGIIADVESVGWLKYRDLDELKPTLDTRLKDFLSCLKYALASGLHAKKHKDKVYYANKSPYGLELPHKRRFKSGWGRRRAM